MMLGFSLRSALVKLMREKKIWHRGSLCGAFEITSATGRTRRWSRARARAATGTRAVRGALPRAQLHPAAIWADARLELSEHVVRGNERGRRSAEFRLLEVALPGRENYCGNQKGFRLTGWTFPQGPSLTLTYLQNTNNSGEFVLDEGVTDAISEVTNSLGRKPRAHA